MKRYTHTEVSSGHMSVRWIDAFLARGTCDRILEELDVAFWKPSTVVRRRYDGLSTESSDSRRSDTAHEKWFSPQLKRDLRVIERRLVRLLGCDKARYEAWQATRYRRGDRFDYHYDAGYWSAEPSGDRERTVLIYLTTPCRGGGTQFRELNVDVEARAGRLLTWTNILPSGKSNLRSLHAGAPVASGTKTVIVNWIRQRDIPITDRRSL